MAGGVAANGFIRGRLRAIAAAADLRLVVPPARLCTDNATMIAWAGIERLRRGYVDGLDFAPRPRWPLDPAAPGRSAPASRPEMSPQRISIIGAGAWGTALAIVLRRAKREVLVCRRARPTSPRPSAPATRTRSICRASGWTAPSRPPPTSTRPRSARPHCYARRRSICAPSPPNWPATCRRPRRSSSARRASSRRAAC